MPTGKGWCVGGVGVALWILGAALGTPPLSQLGFAIVVLIAMAVAVVRWSRHDLAITRRVTPERVRAGHEVQVSLVVANRGRGPAPLLLVQDRVPPGLGRRARASFHGIEPGREKTASFVLTPRSRGNYEIGPLDVSSMDPFGLARVRFPGAGKSPFLVHPPIENLTDLRDLGRRRTTSSSALRQPTGARGEEFYTLREYASGDDLRKIHWASTAKRQKYMIRQEETPWQTRATVLLDDRREGHEGSAEDSSFETAVSAAASFADLYHRSGYSFRLIGVNHPGVPFARGAAHLHRCLDLLATVEATTSTSEDAWLSRLAALEAGSGAEGTLIAVAGSLTPVGATAIARCSRRFRQVVVIAVPAHRFGRATTRARWQQETDTVDALRVLTRAGIPAATVGPGESVAAAWAALGGTRRGGESVPWERKRALV